MITTNITPKIIHIQDIELFSSGSIPGVTGPPVDGGAAVAGSGCASTQSRIEMTSSSFKSAKAVITEPLYSLKISFARADLPLARNFALFFTHSIIRAPSPAASQRFLASNNFGPVPFLCGWWQTAHFALNKPSP